METNNLEILKNKCLLFNQFMRRYGGFPVELSAAFDESDKLIEKAYQEKDLKPLKAMSRDIDNQVLKHMPLTMAIKLKELFKEELNINFDAVEKAILKSIDKIVKKGKISNASEYELLLNRVEEIYSDESKKEEVEKLNMLLADYHKQ